MATSLRTMTRGALLAVTLARPALAEPLVPKSLYFTTINVPTNCAEIAMDESGVWRCSLGLGTYADMNVQLDEMLIRMEQISDQTWADDDVVAVLTGPFFENWMKGATASTPNAMTRWQIVADKDLPPGMAACNDYRFDRRDEARHLYFVEQGRFCVLTRHPVQWPYILVGSVSLRTSHDQGAPYPDVWIVRAQAILSTFRLTVH